MKKLLTILPLLLMACMTTTGPGSATIIYTIELINGGMSMIYYVNESGEIVAEGFVEGDSVYCYEFEFEPGAAVGAGAYPDANSAVTVIIAEDGEHVVTEYILVNEPTLWFWNVGE